LRVSQPLVRSTSEGTRSGGGLCSTLGDEGGKKKRSERKGSIDQDHDVVGRMSARLQKTGQKGGRENRTGKKFKNRSKESGKIKT